MAHRPGARALLATTALLAAHTARADGIGWVWYSGSATPYAQYTYNSARGAVTISQTETGFYNVTFSGLGGAPANNGVAIASGYNSNVTCQAGSIAPSGADMVVQVNCWNPRGGQANTDFSLFYEQRTRRTQKGRDAYVYNSAPSAAIGTPFAPAATGTFNSTGGINTITHTATGAYTVTLPGLTHLGGTVQVTAGGFLDAAHGGFSARCQVTSWGVQSPSTVALVTCVDGNNQPVDTYFQLVYTIAAPSTNGLSHTTGAYAWANHPNYTSPYTPNPNYQFNNYTSGQLGASRYSAGAYVVTIPAGQTPSTTVAIVNAHNLPGGYCNVLYWSDTSVNVNCYDALGQPANGQFDLFYGAVIK